MFADFFKNIVDPHPEKPGYVIKRPEWYTIDVRNDTTFAVRCSKIRPGVNLDSDDHVIDFSTFKLELIDFWLRNINGESDIELLFDRICDSVNPSEYSPESDLLLLSRLKKMIESNAIKILPDFFRVILRVLSKIFHHSRLAVHYRNSKHVQRDFSIKLLIYYSEEYEQYFDRIILRPLYYRVFVLRLFRKFCPGFEVSPEIEAVFIKCRVLRRRREYKFLSENLRTSLFPSTRFHGDGGSAS